MFLTYFLFISLFCLVNGGCQFHVTVFRQLRKEGFHLELTSNIEIVVGSDKCPVWESCTLALVEPLSSSFFVKPGELSNPPVFGCSVFPFNIEDPQCKSSSGQLYLYTPLQLTLNLIHNEVKAPIHLRYHSPKSGGGFSSAYLGRPKLLLQCEQSFNTVEAHVISAPCPVCAASNCTWLELPFQTNVNNFTVPVPVGDSEHLFFVPCITYFLAVGGCLYLSLTILSSVTFV